MRFEELGIRTLRQAPANARGAADALLKRAGYVGADGSPTPLGEKALDRMRGSGASCKDLVAKLRLDPHTTSGGELVAESPDGSLELLRCPACAYSAESEMAGHRLPDTPPEEAVPITRVPTPNCNTIDELAHFLNVPTSKTAKAMMYVRPSDDRFVFVVVRGDTRLSARKLHGALGVLEPASAAQVMGAGAVPGYASPVGLRGPLIVVDQLIPSSPNLVCGANEAGYHLRNSNYGRDYTAEVVGDFTLAAPGDGCPRCGEPLVGMRGRLLADRNGCHYEALLFAVAERHHDERGLCLPLPCAPFDVHLIQIPSREVNTKELADTLHERLSASAVSVLYDDRELRAGVKFFDADLIGLPVRLTAGERGLRSGMIEFKVRSSSESTAVAIGNIVEAVRAVTALP